MSKIDELEVETKWSGARNARIQGQFLKGPIPLADIARAARLPGQALGLFLAVHHRTALTGSSSVTLPAALLQQLGISRDAKARALHTLEQASLVTVERASGRTAKIQLV